MKNRAAGEILFYRYRHQPHPVPDGATVKDQDTIFPGK